VSAFLRQLEDLEVQIDRAYQFDELPFADGKFCPIEIKNMPWAKFSTYRQETQTGRFSSIRNYSSSLPTIEVQGEEFRQEVFKWGSSYHWSDDDIAAFARTGESLESSKIYAIQEAYSQSLNKLIAYGDPSLNMPGFVNHPDSLRTISQYPLNSSATSQQKLAVLNDCANTIVQFTKQIEKPDTLLMDVQTYQHLTSEIILIGNTALNKTLLEHFLDANPYIKDIGVANELSPEAFEEVGLPRKRQIIAFKRDPLKVKALIYQPLTYLEARRMGVDSWTRAAVFKYAGIQMRRPFSVHVMELPE
jgi:hypothetical protein